MSRQRRVKALYILVAILLPAAVVGYANGVFAYNHFYSLGAYLLDSGWFSGVIHHNGITLANPPIANPHATYWELHFSVIFVIASLLSYVVPLDRIDYYWLCQGLMHAPLGAAVGLSLSKAARPRSVAAIVGIAIVALVFSFNGQALACMGYPHYETFLAAGICLMLAGLASGRPVLAWLGLAAALATREDGGLHAGTFLAAVLACDVLGKPFGMKRREVFIMAVVAGAATVLMMAAQRKVFHGGSLLQHEYLGEPAYAHITMAVVRARAVALAHNGSFIWGPFVVTALVAAVNRDARWLLGYAATLPWFVLNFLAVQQLKTEFGLYTGFPFLASIFWLCAYGVVKYGFRRATLVPIGLASLATSLGLVANEAYYLPFQIPLMASPRHVDASAVRSFARELRARPDAYGRLLVDPSVASLAVESLPGEHVVLNETPGRTDLARYDAVAFYQDTFMGIFVLVDPIVRGGFTSCARLPGTEIRYCSRTDRTTPPHFVPYSFFKSMLHGHMGGGTVEGDGERVYVEPGDPTALGVFGPLMKLSGGHYRAIVELRPASGATCAAPVRVEPFVFARGESLAKADIAPGTGPTSIDFDLPDVADPPNTEIRFYRAACRYEIATLEVRARE